MESKIEENEESYKTFYLYDLEQIRELFIGLQLSDCNPTLETETVDTYTPIFADLKVGQSLPGKVSHNSRVGSYIDIGSGYHGFLHKAHFKGHSLYEGTEVQVNISQINFENKSLNFTLDSILSNDEAIIEASPYSVSSTMMCSVCNAHFNSRDEQVQHYKLDWHRYNLKQRLNGRDLVDEDNFNKLADDISSLSGTDEESCTEEVSGNDSNSTSGSEPMSSPRKKLSTLKDRRFPPRERSNSLNSTDTEDECPGNSSKSDHKSRSKPKVFLKNSKGDLLALYRCVVHGKENIPDSSSGLLALVQGLPVQTKWMVILIGGGHFAAAIMNGSEVVLHKTFHRYTVRAKQGGSQGNRDSKHGGQQPKSSGASLRRYNEGALIKDIQDLMLSWSVDLATCHRIFFRAATFNRAALFGGKNPPFKKNDFRLRTIPFPTRRATFAEVQRIHKALSTVESFGNHKLFKTSLPQSPKVHLGKKSPKKGSFKAKPTKLEKLELNEPKLITSLDIPVKENVSEDSLDCNVLGALDEIHDTTHLKEFQVTQKRKMNKGKKRNSLHKHQRDPLTSPMSGEEYQFKNAIYGACKTGDVVHLLQLLKLAESNEAGKDTDAGNVYPENQNKITISSEDSLDCNIQQPSKAECSNVSSMTNPTTTLWSFNISLLGDSIGSNGSTLLHVAAKEGHKEVISLLMEYGANPSIKNKQGYTPYNLAGEKETRNEFRRFMAKYPDKFDYSKSQIPGPLTEDLEREANERNRERKKKRKEKIKERKIEEAEKKTEQEEQDRFLRLSDREKRALAADRRLLAMAPSNQEAVVLSRCFKCAADITGKVPFEYNSNNFCSMACLKIHRKKS